MASPRPEHPTGAASPSSAPGSPASPPPTCWPGRPVRTTSPSTRPTTASGVTPTPTTVVARGPHHRRRHRLHRPQRPDLPHAAAALRRARRRDAGLRHEHVDPRRRRGAGVCRGARPAGPVPQRPQPALSPRYLRMLGGGQAVPPRGRGGCWPSRRRRTLSPARPWARSSTGSGFSPFFVALVPRAARRRRLVVRPGRRPALPRALPVPLPRPPRHAHRLRLADLAHRHRAGPPATSSGSRPASTTSGWAGPSPRSPSRPTASAVDRRAR